VTLGPALRAELPAERKDTGNGVAVRAALAHGLAVIAGGPRGSASDVDDGDEARRTLTEYCTSSPWERSQEGAQYQMRVETGLLLQKMIALIDRGCVQVRTDLVCLHDPEPISLAALVHFLLALNSRLRLARGSLLADRIVLEVVLPAWSVSTGLLDQAMSALMVGTRLAKRECAALLQPETAHAYCTFHNCYDRR